MYDHVGYVLPDRFYKCLAIIYLFRDNWKPLQKSSSGRCNTKVFSGQCFQSCELCMVCN